jgi:hypothetical protein
MCYSSQRGGCAAPAHCAMQQNLGCNGHTSKWQGGGARADCRCKRGGDGTIWHFVDALRDQCKDPSFQPPSSPPMQMQLPPRPSPSLPPSIQCQAEAASTTGNFLPCHSYLHTPDHYHPGYPRASEAQAHHGQRQRRLPRASLTSRSARQSSVASSSPTTACRSCPG